MKLEKPIKLTEYITLLDISKQTVDPLVFGEIVDGFNDAFSFDLNTNERLHHMDGENNIKYNEGLNYLHIEIDEISSPEEQPYFNQTIFIFYNHFDAVYIKWKIHEYYYMEDSDDIFESYKHIDFNGSEEDILEQMKFFHL